MHDDSSKIPESLVETQRLLVRPFTLQDLDTFHEIFGSPDVMQYIPSGTSATREASVTRLSRIINLHQQTGLSLWAVVEKSSGKILGDCGLFLVEGRGPDVEVAYHFAKAAWGDGYATEAATACIRYGFETVGLSRIVALVIRENQASVRVIEKSGLVYESPGRYYNQDLEIYAAEAGAWLGRDTVRRDCE